MVDPESAWGALAGNNAQGDEHGSPAEEDVDMGDALEGLIDGPCDVECDAADPCLAIPDSALQIMSDPTEGPWAVNPLRPHLPQQVAMQPFRSVAANDIEQLANHFLSDMDVGMTSLQQLAEKLGVYERSVGRALFRLASCLVHCDRHFRAKFEEHLRDSGAELLMYVDMSRYDETPMKIRKKQFLVDLDSSLTALEDAPADGGSLATFKTQASDLSIPVGHETVARKLFATDSRFAALVRCETEGGYQHVAFLGRSLTWIQDLEHTTAECIRRALLEANPLSEACNSFAFKVRATTTDKHASNFKSERSLVDARGADWLFAHLFCNVHVCATGTTRTFSLVNSDISGLINFSLTFASGGHMHKFRRCLAAVIAEKINVIRGSPPLDVIAYQQAMLSLFLSRGTKLRERRFLLSKLPNGDWRKRDCVDVYVPEHEPVRTAAAIAPRLIRGILVALTGRTFTSYPRHRWTGADIALDEFGLLDAVHGIGTRAFMRYLALTSKKKEPPAPPVDVPPAEPLLALPAPEAVAAAPDVAMGRADEEPADEGAEGGEDDGAPAVAAEIGDTVDWAALNARVKRVAAEWIATAPFGRVIVMRVVLEPWRQLMHSFIEMSGEAWELKQRLQESTFLSRGVGEPRSYRVATFASLKLEKAFLAQVADRLKVTHWTHLPAERRTYKERALCFKMLSRAGCAVEQLLCQKARECPVLLFRLLVDPIQAAADLRKLPPCMLDPVAKAFLERHPDEKLLEQEAMYELQTLALVIFTDTVGVERDHSGLRRVIESQSCMTHRTELPFAAAQRLCSKYRVRARATPIGAVRAAAAKRAWGSVGQGQDSGQSPHSCTEEEAWRWWCLASVLAPQQAHGACARFCGDVCALQPAGQTG